MPFDDPEEAIFFSGPVTIEGTAYDPDFAFQANNLAIINAKLRYISGKNRKRLLKSAEETMSVL